MVILAGIFLTGCKKNEFRIEMTLPADVGATYTVVYYCSGVEGGFITESAVAVHEGKGKFMGITRQPTLVYIMGGGGRLPGAVIYAERGDKIEIRGEKSQPLYWEIRGNKLTEQLSEWRNAHRDAIEAASAEYHGSSKSLNAAIAESVKKSPGEPLSALLLYIYYDRREDSKGFTALKKLLKDKAAKGDWAELVSRSDMINDPEGELKIPEKLVFRSVFTGCDTLSLRNVPTLIYFSERQREDYEESIKILRQLSREYGDSDKRAIVNVSIEPDSLNYINSWHRDSLQGAIQAWTPLGLADDEVIKVGVRRIPWVLVVDAKGKALYTGQDMEKGAETFRGLMKKVK